MTEEQILLSKDLSRMSENEAVLYGIWSCFENEIPPLYKEKDLSHYFLRKNGENTQEIHYNPIQRNIEFESVIYYNNPDLLRLTENKLESIIREFSKKYPSFEFKYSIHRVPNFGLDVPLTILEIKYSGKIRFKERNKSKLLENIRNFICTGFKIEKEIGALI